MLAQTTVFKSNQLQAIRLTKMVALDDHSKQVKINAYPNEHKWDDWFDQVNTTDDFMRERSQEGDQLR